MLKRFLCLAVPVVLLASAYAAAQETDKETPQRRGGRQGRGGREGMRQRMMRDDGAPKPGDKAPPLKLKRLDDQSKEVDLSGFAGKKPVLLIFGSYT